MRICLRDGGAWFKSIFHENSHSLKFLFCFYDIKDECIRVACVQLGNFLLSTDLSWYRKLATVKSFEDDVSSVRLRQNRSDEGPTLLAVVLNGTKLFFFFL